MHMLYTIARKVWDSAKWIWLTLIIVFLIGLAANLAVVQTTDLSKTVLVSVLNWLALLGLMQTLLLSACGLFIVLTLSALIIKTMGEHSKGGKALRKYLHSVVSANEGLSPTGIFQQSQALISVNVPLDDVFIHLHADPDRPIHDVLDEQRELLEELQKLSELSDEERQKRVQELRITRYSQLGQELLGTRTKQDIDIEEVLHRLEPASPVAVILGPPGSGKSTAMRWLALHMARANLSWRYPLSQALSPKQVPVLLRISDYAKGLSTNADLSFAQFFSEHYVMLQDKLEQGRCLLLFDGLDEIASDRIRMEVAKAIYTFILNHSAQEPKAKLYNRFIITSRIVGYQDGTFAKYTHYTLLDLEDKQIEGFLTHWCPAVERHLKYGTKKLTLQQEAHMSKTGHEQRDRLLDAIRNNPSIKRLAAWHPQGVPLHI